LFASIFNSAAATLEAVLKKIGKRAESLAEQKGHSLDG
jgi:hypothetical protein